MKISSQKITPFLWFNDQAEEAANFYVELFSKREELKDDTSVTKISRYTDAGPGPKGMCMVAEFKLGGQVFIALNGGPQFKFTEAVSFVINCHSQEEVDYFWNNLLTNGGSESMCGWLQDKYGLWWQVVPVQLGQLMAQKDAAKAGQVMNAMLKMRKIIIQELEEAAIK